MVVMCCLFVDSVTEMLLSTACAGLGLGVATSKAMRTTPLSGMLDGPTVILLSVALGRFIFTLIHLLHGHCHQPTDVAGWTMFRTVYVIVSIICLSVIIVTGDNLVLAAIVLLLELGMAAEETSRAVERLATADLQAKSIVLDRLKRVLTLIGALLVVVHILLPATLLVTAVLTLQSPFVLGPRQVFLLCFGVVFYTLTALHLLSSQRRRRRLVVPRSLKPPAIATHNVIVKRRPVVGAMSVDGKRRHVHVGLLQRSGAEFLLHAVRGRKVCSIDVYNAIRIAAASANINSHRRQISSPSA